VDSVCVEKKFADASNSRARHGTRAEERPVQKGEDIDRSAPIPRQGTNCDLKEYEWSVSRDE
jgi:hypothetical protein